MKLVIFDIAVVASVVIITAMLCYLIWGPVPPIPPADPIAQELRAEINRLKPYEEFMKQTNVVITYNGCEDIRKRLGITL